MRRAIEHLLVAPLARLIASNQVKAGDVISIRLKDGLAEFVKEGRDAKTAGLVK